MYAGGVPAYAQAVAGDANVSVKTYGSAEKLIVTAAGTLTVGKETVALTLPANVEATFDGNTVNDGASAGGTFQVLKNAVVTLGGTAPVSYTHLQQAYTNDGVNNDFYTVKAVGSRSFSLNDANQEQLTVNNETVYVLATYDLKDNKSTYKMCIRDRSRV